MLPYAWGREMADPEGSTLAPGTRVGDRFVLERLLRREVVTEVYLARNEGGGTARFEVRRVLAPVPPPGAEQVVRKELDRVAAAGCRSIPAIVAVAPDPAGLLVISEAPEALAPRETLRDVVARGEGLPSRDALRVLREVARVLDVLHALGPQVLHRALSPENVSLMERRQKVWLTESGLAHALHAAGVIPPRAHIVGPAYRSPDEILQRPTARGDVFALASLAHEALTGSPAFRAASEAATESAMLRGPRSSVAPAVSQSAARVDAVLHRAWSVDVDGGYAKATDFVAALERAFDASVEGEAPLSSRTIIGLGAPSQRSVGARPAPPRAPVVPEPGGDASRQPMRVQPPTQKVQVPQFHPPGTEPVAPDAAREDREKPPTSTPPRAPVARPIGAPPERPKPEPARSVSAAMGGRITRAPGEVPPDQYEITKPVRIDPPPEAKGDILAERRGAPSEAPEARDSWESVLQASPSPSEKTTLRAPSDESDELPTRPPPAPSALVPTVIPTASDDEEETDEEAIELTPLPVSRTSVPVPSKPPPPPAAARISHTSLPPAVEVVAHAPSPPALPSTPPALPSSAPASEPPRESPLPPVEAPPVAPAPADDFSFPSLIAEPPPERIETPVPPPPIPPPLADEVAVPPPRPPISDARTQPPPAQRAPAPPPARRSPRRIVFGLVAFVAIAAGAGLLWTNHYGPPPPMDVPPRAPVVRRAVALDAQVAVDAHAPSAADVLAIDRLAPQQDVLTVADATAADVTAVDATARADVAVAPPPAVAAPPDAGAAPSATGLAAPVISREPLRGHPRGRETIALEDAMFDEIMACVGRRHRRKVRVTATYLGATGLVDQLHIASPYNEPETAPCIERVVRRHPVGRFTATDWETGFVFDPEDR